MPGLLDEARRFRQALIDLQNAETRRLIQEYGRIYAGLDKRMKTLEEALGELPAGAEHNVTERQMERVRSLREQIEVEVTKFGGRLDDHLDDAVHASVVAGSKGGVRMLKSAGIGGSFNILPTDAIETMLGFMADGSPLHGALTTRLGFTVAERVEQRIIDGIALGFGPRKVARQIVREKMGEGLAWAMTTARTAMAWGYREANRAQMAANANIVPGWLWWSARDGRVCMACLAMDNGAVHPPTETLRDHHNGRCVPVPAMSNAVTAQTGQQWFAEQDPTLQRQQMGDSRWQDWKAGKFEFRDLATTYQDPVYGEMVREATMKGLRSGKRVPFVSMPPKG